MSEFLRIYLPWLMSAITLYTMWGVGDRKANAWAIGLGNQVLWFTWIVSAAAWGLLPMTIALTFVYARNLMKWNRS